MCIATRLWLTGMSLNSIYLGEESHGVYHTVFFLPEFCSVFPTYISSALSKGLGSFFIWPMKATHRKKNLLHQGTVFFKSPSPQFLGIFASVELNYYLILFHFTVYLCSISYTPCSCSSVVEWSPNSTKLWYVLGFQSHSGGKASWVLQVIFFTFSFC